mmetsp:Transcript_10644/g.33655  ORF Transcript_10644/g.33655 Transcript_10644/m.33655 type:complete len:335 (-) Transcript_10644:498-1502(-)
MRMDEDVVGPDIRAHGHAQDLNKHFGSEDNAVVLLAGAPHEDLAGGHFHEAEAQADDEPPGPEARRGEGLEEPAEGDGQEAAGGQSDAHHVCDCRSQPLDGVGRRARPQHDCSGLEHTGQRHDLLPELNDLQAVTSDDSNRAGRSHVADEAQGLKAPQGVVIPHGPGVHDDVDHLHGLQGLLRRGAAGARASTAALEAVRPAALGDVVDEEGAAGGGRAAAHRLVQDEGGDRHGHASYQESNAPDHGVILQVHAQDRETRPEGQDDGQVPDNVKQCKAQGLQLFVPAREVGDHGQDGCLEGVCQVYDDEAWVDRQHPHVCRKEAREQQRATRDR